MPETRLTRALLTGAVIAVAALVVILVLRLLTIFMGDPRLWALVVLAFVAAFVLQWFMDRRAA